MFYGYGYFQYLIYAAPVLIFALITQLGIKSTYSKYSKVPNSRCLTGAQAAQYVLNYYGIRNVRIVPCQGKLTDNFNPKDNTIYLSQDVYNGTSVASVGVACHEAGHAAQHAENYVPNKIRSAIVPITNFGSRFGLIIAFAGYFLAYASRTSFGYYMIIFGLMLYGLIAVFQLVTLPVEFNASNRALKVIRETGVLIGDEYNGAKKVLLAAAMTYVAALITALFNVLYYAFRLLENSKRN